MPYTVAEINKRITKMINGRLMQDEKIEDVITMIKIIIKNRAAKFSRHYTKASLNRDIELTGKIICVITDPLEPPSYQDSAIELRKMFSGISNDEFMKKKFNDCLSKDLTEIESVEQAVKIGIDSLFNLNSGMNNELQTL